MAIIDANRERMSLLDKEVNTLFEEAQKLFKRTRIELKEVEALLDSALVKSAPLIAPTEQKQRGSHLTLVVSDRR